VVFKGENFSPPLMVKTEDYMKIEHKGRKENDLSVERE
jgi:hypothetical protein